MNFLPANPSRSKTMAIVLAIVCIVNLIGLPALAIKKAKNKKKKQQEIANIIAYIRTHQPINVLWKPRPEQIIRTIHRQRTWNGCQLHVNIIVKWLPGTLTIEHEQTSHDINDLAFTDPLTTLCNHQFSGYAEFHQWWISAEMDYATVKMMNKSFWGMLVLQRDNNGLRIANSCEMWAMLKLTQPDGATNDNFNISFNNDINMM